MCYFEGEKRKCLRKANHENILVFDPWKIYCTLDSYVHTAHFIGNMSCTISEEEASGTLRTRIETRRRAFPF
jgi:hypothetical protein